MIKLLLFILLGFVLYSFFMSLLRPPSSAPPQSKAKEVTGETMVEDPVCGTCLPQQDAIKAHIRGHDYYFCSAKCLAEFRELDKDSTRS